MRLQVGTTIRRYLLHGPPQKLTFRLRNLGYEIEAGRSGAPEIKGYTREYLEASSPRSQQIRQYLEETGFQGPAAAQIAAHETRDNKQIHSTAEVMAAHYKVAAAHGHQAEQVIAAARERQQSQPLERIADAPSRAQEAVTYAKQGGFEREAVSDERLLMRDALRRGMGDITYPEVRKNFDRRVEAGEFQTVAAAKHATGRQFTTPETMAMERSTVRSLRLGQDATEPTMQADAAAQQALSRPQLNDGQRKAIEEILTSRDRVHGLQGLAGTGKTTTLAVIREGAEKNGYAVEGFAPSSRAANQLRQAGVSADTLQGFLVRGSTGSVDPASRHLYMLDESSLASTRQMRDFLAKIGPQDRVLVIGDIRQHQGIDAGKPFEQMQDAGMRTAQLDKIVRQQDPALLAAVEKLSRNETAEGVAMLQKQGRVTQVEDREQRIAAIAKDYAAKPENTIIVSPDNASRREINKAVRTELQETGQVSRSSEFLPTLISRSELTGADRQWAARYHQGDVLHYSTGSKDLGIARRSYATVTSVDPEQNRLTVLRQDGQQVTYDPKRLQGVSAYQEIGRDFAKGDRLQFTAPSKDLGVANRDLGTIENIHYGIVTVRLDGKEKPITFDSAKMRHFDHGYAVTSHSSQGVTAERVLVNMDTRVHSQLINTRFAYVSVSRASHEAQIYTNDAAALGQKLSHDASKSSAIDFRQQISATHTTDTTRAQTQQPRKEQTMTPSYDDRYAAITRANLSGFPDDLAQNLVWKNTTGKVSTYEHVETHKPLHIYHDAAHDRMSYLVSNDPHAKEIGMQSAVERVAPAVYVKEWNRTEGEKMAQQFGDLPRQHAETAAPKEIIYRPADNERHYAPLNRELNPADAQKFGWKAENGTVQSYQHADTLRHIHIDGPSGQFYNQQKEPVTQHAALDHAIGAGRHHAPGPAKVQEVTQQRVVDNSMGFGL